MIVLTNTQRAGLAELASACSYSLSRGGQGWVRTRDLGGTKYERSSTNLHSLVRLGLVQGRRYGAHSQTQWNWRITHAGLEVLGLNDFRNK